MNDEDPGVQSVIEAAKELHVLFGQIKVVSDCTSLIYVAAVLADVAKL